MSLHRKPHVIGCVLSFGILAIVPVTRAAGETITVDTTDDVTDFAGAQRVGDLPGADGRVSFREACIAANNTAGPQTIAFAIPPAPDAEWSGGVAILFMDYSVFPLSDDETTVDFTTQTAFTGDTNPNGNEVGLRCAPITGAPAIYVSGDRCLIKGFDRASYVGYAIQLAGNDNRVIGCTVSGPLYAGVYISGGFNGPPASGNIVGGTAPGEGNVLSSGNHGVRIDTPADNNIVIGNQLSGTFAGAAVRGNPYTGSPVGNRIGGPTPEERNIIAGAGKYGEEGFPDGAQVSLVMAIDTLIEGNYIGTTPDGSAAASQRGPAGVEVRDSIGTVIRNNLISGIRVPGVNHYAGQLFGAGVFVSSTNADTFDTVIEGNIIGADPTGGVPVPNLYGVNVSPYTALNLPYDTTIDGNRIAFNERAGVRVQSLVTGVTITANSIAENGGLGIDLLDNTAAAGVHPNDPGDADGGGNSLQNFPVLEAAVTSGATMQVTGTLNSTANQSYDIEFFASAGCDPSGHGEGDVFLGATTVLTDASGNARFESLVAGAAAGMQITATATRVATGETSEFSECLEAQAGVGPRGDMNCDGGLDAEDIDPFFMALGDVTAYKAAYPKCDFTRADINGDGGIDSEDIDPFFACLGNGGCP